MIWSLVHNIILFIVIIFLASYILGFSVRYRKENKYGFNSTIISSVLLVVLAFCIVIFDWLLPYPLNAAINIWLGIILAIQVIYFVIIKFKFKEEGDKQNIDKEAYENGKLKLQREFLRKSFHTVVLLVVICYFFLAFLINDFVYQIYALDINLYYSIWNTHDYPLLPSVSSQLTIASTWTLMLFICALLMLIIPDIFRIYNRKYSLFSGVYKRVIRMKELYAVGPQIYLTLACVFVFLLANLGILNTHVVIAAMLIAAFGDAAAALIGRKYGKHKFKTILQKDELKSQEGLIAGFIVSFIMAIIFVNPIVALIGAAIFSLIDVLNPRIADNVLNPILCSLAMMTYYWVGFI